MCASVSACVCPHASVHICIQKIKRLDASIHKRISASRHVFCSRTFGIYYTCILYKYPRFNEIRKLMNTYRTLGLYINRCTQMSERVTASPGDLFLVKALSCAIKANHIQDGAATKHVQREISVSVATKKPFW